MSQRHFLNRAVAFLCAGILSVSSFCVTNAFAENIEIPEETITENTKRTPRELLKLTLDYCETFDYSRYQGETVEQLFSELVKAQELYENELATDEELTKMRADLEKIKANLLFNDTRTPENPMPFRFLTGDELMAEMGVGINLGNTMDGHSNLMPNETSWQSVKTTKEYITALHDAGFNTVRIPVTWGQMIDKNNGYTINASWISRVQDIVDYCISQDMYAIINVHHDGAEQSGWLRVSAEDIDKVYEQYEYVWRNIAEYFKDYDEHLIFESMNEITCMEGDDKNSAEAIDYDTPIIVNLNQIFVNVVRSTGSNNRHRWLAVVAHYANSGNHKEFTLPTDSYNGDNRLMFAAHIYKANTNVEWTYDEVYQVVNNLKIMADKFDIPMFLGEYGNRTQKQDGTDTGYNDVARAYFSEIVHRACKTAGVVPVVWDQGHSEDPLETGLFTYFDRHTNKPLFKSITDAMMRGTFLESSELNNNWDYSDIVSNPKIVPFKSVEIKETIINIELGGSYDISYTLNKPSGCNDVLLWKTSDSDIATVYNGKIFAQALGKTTITAFSQNGKAKDTIVINVVPPAEIIPATSIMCDDVFVAPTKRAYLSPTVSPADADDTVTYKSSDESIVTVNEMGKVVGLREGVAYVTITASSGVTKNVKVTVCDSVIQNEINLSLHIYYNDHEKEYYETETGESVNITGDGQYTLSFDVNKDLSKYGQKTGITSLNNVQLITIRDSDVSGALTKYSSTSKGIKIRYDSIKVNGIEIALSDSKFISAMKGKVFDTQGPVNAKDGSVIMGIENSGEDCVSFAEIENPQTIEITFTLKDVSFEKSEAKAVESPAEKLTLSESKVEIPAVSYEKKLEISVNPKNSNSVVYLYSHDESTVFIKDSGKTPDENGKVTFTLCGIKAGKTTVTAICENGVTIDFEVTVCNVTPDEYEKQQAIKRTIKVAGVVAIGLVSLTTVSLIIRAIVKKAKKKKSQKNTEK